MREKPELEENSSPQFDEITLKVPTAVIMAGGKGSRLSPMKPVLKVCGRPMIQWIIDVAEKFSERVIVATVRGHPAEEELSLLSKEIIYTSGKGYEEDVVEALRQVKLPALVLSCDLPFIPREAFETLLRRCRSSICSLYTGSGFVGMSLWNSLNLNDYETIHFHKDIINVNTIDELEKANKLCSNL
ncbi:NTP transferase domain-containing protein [Metallosphaera tengchongensis]|uniref:NTP transferase domain-containing protein n=1 Tax=Metallosphaera tengchongensis TaxID=1532350 RepID=UPI001FE98998|nr:NTP transferase domain-containing protein [Metallosphaera tengchongensis]